MSEYLCAAVFIAAFSVLNRGRGSHFWNTIDSTVASRLVSILGMSAVTLLISDEDEWRTNVLELWMVATLSLWEFFGWDNYWSAAIGNMFNPDASTFAPVDWLMKQMPWFRSVYTATASDTRRRLWGAIAMGLRQAMAIPCVVGLAYLTGHSSHAVYACGSLLFGFPYLLAGYAYRTSPVGLAEYVVGGLLGLTVYATTS